MNERKNSLTRKCTLIALNCFIYESKVWWWSLKFCAHTLSWNGAGVKEKLPQPPPPTARLLCLRCKCFGNTTSSLLRTHTQSGSIKSDIFALTSYGKFCGFFFIFPLNLYTHKTVELHTFCGGVKTVVNKAHSMHTLRIDALSFPYKFFSKFLPLLKFYFSLSPPPPPLSSPQADFSA